jgi:DNA-binding MarR family transcriptional regulator
VVHGQLQTLIPADLRRELADAVTGLSYVEVSALRSLGLSGRIGRALAFADLAAAPGMDEESAGRLADALQERGLVDHVAVHEGHLDLVMSDRALDLVGRYHDAARSAHGQMMAALDEAELKTMLGLMEKVASGVLGTAREEHEVVAR